MATWSGPFSGTKAMSLRADRKLKSSAPGRPLARAGLTSHWVAVPPEAGADQIVPVELSQAYRVCVTGSMVSPLRNAPGVAAMRSGAPPGGSRQMPDLAGSGLRITARMVGRHSNQLKTLPAGTRVFAGQGTGSRVPRADRSGRCHPVLAPAGAQLPAEGESGLARSGHDASVADDDPVPAVS